GNGSVIRDLVLDPQDWRRVFVLRGNEVWMTDDVTHLHDNPFTNITANLFGGAGALTTQVRTITLFDNPPGVADDSILLACGSGGGGGWGGCSASTAPTRAGRSSALGCPTSW